MQRIWLFESSFAFCETSSLLHSSFAGLLMNAFNIFTNWIIKNLHIFLVPTSFNIFHLFNSVFNYKKIHSCNTTFVKLYIFICSSCILHIFFYFWLFTYVLNAGFEILSIYHFVLSQLHCNCAPLLIIINCFTCFACAALPFLYHLICSCC